MKCIFNMPLPRDSCCRQTGQSLVAGSKCDVEAKRTFIPARMGHEYRTIWHRDNYFPYRKAFDRKHPSHCHTQMSIQWCLDPLRSCTVAVRVLPAARSELTLRSQLCMLTFSLSNQSLKSSAVCPGSAWPSGKTNVASRAVRDSIRKH